MTLYSRLPAVLLASALLLAPMMVRADDMQDASRLLRQGQQAQALEKINQFLSSKPRDPQGRFLKGLILAEQNKATEAIEVFTKLTQDYPELPEPYNNLAVLYAAQGQYEKARQSLELSIRTHPSYATAYENLGDVYTKLASQAYDKALQLDSSNTSAQTKLSLIRDLVPAGNRAPRPSTRTEPTTIAAAPTPKAAPPAPAPAPKVAEVKPPTAVAAPAAAPAPAPTAASTAPEPKTAPEVPKDAAKNGESEKVLKTVRSWAAAWASKDVKAYLGYYAKGFKAPNGEARGEWEKGRAQRINAPKKIEVSVESPKVSIKDDNSATVTFRQAYRSDHINVSSTKTLVLIKADGHWLILQERVGS